MFLVKEIWKANVYLHSTENEALKPIWLNDLNALYVQKSFLEVSLTKSLTYDLSFFFLGNQKIRPSKEGYNGLLYVEAEHVI